MVINVQSFNINANDNDDLPERKSFDKHYMLLIEIKDSDVLIENKLFIDQPIKNLQEAYEKLVEISRSNSYTTGSLLDFSYHQHYLKPIGPGLSKQKTREHSSRN